MNAEQKQALIEQCKVIISNINSMKKCTPDGAALAEGFIKNREIACIALAALTAQPVKLPSKCKVSAHETRQAYAEGLNHGIELARNAIAEAGYQVEDE